MRVQVYASDKIRPSFELLDQLTEARIIFTDWSLNPVKLIKNLTDMWSADVVYFHSPTNPRILMMPFARLMGKPVMLQWIGSDVLTMTCNERPAFYDIGLEEYITPSQALTSGLSGITLIMVKFTLRKIHWFKRYLNLFVTIHTACAENLVGELRTACINASYLPALIHLSPDLLPLPNSPALMTYIGYHASSDKRQFYGWHSIIRLAKDFPDTPIYVLGRSMNYESVPNNITFLGYIDDIRSIMKEVNCLLRITYHDASPPRLPIEAMAMGRHVICTQKFPHAIQVTNYRELHDTVRRVTQLPEQNIGGFHYIQTHFDQNTIASCYIDMFRKLSGMVS